ncbi:MAG TPA: hypothetical protein VGQ83_13040 [Polyangia bacterium]|jgi:uncharacterized protein involved in exopolysaccharide biosynthesis
MAERVDQPGYGSLAELGTMCVRQARLIGCVVAAGALVGLIAGMVMPRTFAAEVRLLPLSGADPLLEGTGLKNLIGEGSFIEGTPEEEFTMGLIESRAVADAVIARHDLARVYRARDPQDAREQLERRMRTSSDLKSHFVTVTVEDGDPTRARDIADTVLSELDRLASRLTTGPAAADATFMRARQAEVRRDLGAAEDALRDFQGTHGVVELDDQTRMTIAVAAKLQADIITRRVQLSALAGVTHDPRVAKARREIAALERQLQDVERGPAPGAPRRLDEDFNVILPAGALPALALEYGRRLRAVSLHQQVLLLLEKEYQLAMLTGGRTDGAVRVVDRAVVPVSPRVKRRDVVLMAVVLSMGVALIIARIRDDLQRGARLRAVGGASKQPCGEFGPGVNSIR